MPYTYDDAVRELKSLLDNDTEPSLTDQQIDDILTNAARADFTGNSPNNVSASIDDYAASTGYTVGAIVKQNGHFWIAITAGTSTGITFKDMGGLQVQSDSYLQLDGTDLTWEWMGTEWYPTYDLNAAAAAGWRIKAGKVSGKYSFTTDGQTFTRGQWFQNCIAMVSHFSRKGVYTVRCDSISSGYVTTPRLPTDALNG